MKKWKVLSNIKEIKDENQIIEILLKNRGIKKNSETFFNPQISDLTLLSLDIDEKEVQKAKKRIKQAFSKKEEIIIFGDYDVDGVCATAILWETIYSSYKKVLPYIPHRVDEGYGLTIKGIKNILSKNPNTKVIITVDNGIVAKDAVDFANENKIDVIITDHHLREKKTPNALAVIHSTKICGAAVAWVFSRELGITSQEEVRKHLELVALATVADLMPSVDANRTLLINGLGELRKTKRAGLIELISQAGIDKKNIGVYEMGHIIGPKLNATGRLLHAIDSLRLICMRDHVKAREQALMLGKTNRDRQLMTEEFTLHAKSVIEKNNNSKIIFASNKSYNQGVIGLVASKLSEEYYKPSFVLSVGEKFSKGSARSVKGFNIIEFLRLFPEYLLEAGGHAMAAGFTIETQRIDEFKKKLEQKAAEIISNEVLQRLVIADLSLNFQNITPSLYQKIQMFYPFGIANPEPSFFSQKTIVEDMKLVGSDNKHLKLNLSQNGTIFDCIAFGMGEKAGEIHIGDEIDIVYTIDENTWNGNKKLQLKIKDLRKN